MLVSGVLISNLRKHGDQPSKFLFSLALQFSGYKLAWVFVRSITKTAVHINGVGRGRMSRGKARRITIGKK